MGSGMHHLVKILLALLAFTCLAAWVVTSININEQKTFWSSYSRVDASFLTATILAWLWFSAVLLFGGLNAFVFRALPVIVVSAVFGCWFFADAVTYAAQRWDFPTRCAGGVINPLGCRRIYRSLLGLSWVDFILSFVLIGLLAMLASGHARKYNTTTSGFHAPVHPLGNETLATGRDGVSAYPHPDVKAPPAREVTHTSPGHTQGDSQTV